MLLERAGRAGAGVADAGRRPDARVARGRRGARRRRPAAQRRLGGAAARASRTRGPIDDLAAERLRRPAARPRPGAARRRADGARRTCRRTVTPTRSRSCSGSTASRWSSTAGASATRGPDRDRFRGTAAHNTVTVAGRDQCDLWGPFRAAHMPRVRRLVTEASADAVRIVAEHDGYSGSAWCTAARSSGCPAPASSCSTGSLGAARGRGLAPASRAGDRRRRPAASDRWSCRRSAAAALPVIERGSPQPLPRRRGAGAACSRAPLRPRPARRSAGRCCGRDTGPS